MPYNIPNLLTLLRIVMIPVLVIVLYLPISWAHIAATIIFVMAAITDWLDGYLARKWNQTSPFGAFLDPVADKLIVVIALVVLVDINPIPYDALYMVIPAVIIIGREITISALREWMAELGQRTSVAVAYIGKVKTAAQMTAISFLLYHETLFGISFAQVGLVLLYCAAALTLWSMLVYLKAAWPVLTSE